MAPWDLPLVALWCTSVKGRKIEVDVCGECGGECWNILYMPNYILYIKGHQLNHFYGVGRGEGEAFFKVWGVGGVAFLKTEMIIPEEEFSASIAWSLTSLRWHHRPTGTWLLCTPVALDVPGQARYQVSMELLCNKQTMYVCYIGVENKN